MNFNLSEVNNNVLSNLTTNKSVYKFGERNFGNSCDICQSNGFGMDYPCQLLALGPNVEEYCSVQHLSAMGLNTL